MSSIKLSPSASGTGEFTIAAPNSNTNRTLNLPDASGTVVTKSGTFIAPSELASGTANNTTFLRGDNTWQTIAGVDTTSVLNATAGLSLGAVGSYSFLFGVGNLAPGATVAGSSLFYASAMPSLASSPRPPGTWRTLGKTGGAEAPSDSTTLFVRIS